MTLRLRLKLAFAAVALAALGTGLSSWLQSRRLEGDAQAINLVGSQRMRSYRLAMLAAEHVAFPAPATGEAIEADLAAFRATLARLGDGDPATGLKPAPTAEALAALESGRELFESYELSLRAIVANANERARIEGGRGGEPELRAASEGLAATAAALAGRMDRATAEFERASALAVRRYRELQLALFAATAAVALASFAAIRRTVLARLPALERALGELRLGRLGAEVPAGLARDEVGRLEAAFNEASRELERARATILAHEAELARRNDALVRADAMKSQFVATMSHELRTPLTSILGFADLLGRGVYGPLEPLQRERVDAILRNARNLLALVGDVLDLAKIEAGRMDLHPARVEPARIVEDVAETLRPLAEARGLALEVSVAPDLPELETDPERVRQVLLNLGSNAVKFTERGAVRVRAGRAAGGVRFEVEDTGIGIAAGDLPRLFGRFEQLDPSPTRRHGGAGLGLHISRRLADLLGGRIEVASEPGRGSRFALILPERVSARREAHADHRQEPTNTRRG